MTHWTIEAAKNALMITGFVFAMMLVIEYLNVLSRGSWQQGLAGGRWSQYVLAAFLGATPGCLGAFAVVTLYSHGIVRMGAVVAAMVATSGDESYVMLAMIPKQGLLLFGVLFVIGVAAGVITDAFAGKDKPSMFAAPHGFDLHHGEVCGCFDLKKILRQWKGCSPTRGVLSVALALFCFGLAAGWLGPPKWNWIRVTLMVASISALFIVSTVPDHFLEEHLWRHVALKHGPRIFLWTFGALIAMHLLTDQMHLDATLQRGRWILLVIACLVGLIPESGPHLIFVTLYAHGSIPLSVLFASSIVQDGHGMLPLLAESRRAFVQIKAINFAVGLLCGALAMAAGF